MNLNSLFVFLSSLMINFHCSVNAQESHYETYTYYTLVAQQMCKQQSSSSCHGWLFGRSCSTSYSNVCSVVYNAVLQQGQKCQTGWSSCNCNVPICSPTCNDGKVCTAPNKCECVATGGGCQSVPCNANTNCYPGTCNKDGSTCTCPSGFSGPNCINIDKTPDISSCQIELYSNVTGAVFRTVACELPQVEPTNTAWIGKESISRIHATWTTNYVQPLSLPSNAFSPHVANAPVPIGVAETGFNVSTAGKPDFYTPSPIENSPKGTVNGDVLKNFADIGIIPQHNQTLKMTVVSKLGGQKTGSNSPTITGSSFPSQSFMGAALTRSALFQFDLMPPVHCLSDQNNNCPLFPIYLDNDITTVSTIEPKFYDWTDQGSGIINFHVEVFFMQPNSQNLLGNTGQAIVKSDVVPSQNNFVFTCTASGVYSIELTVQDQAGNSAKARKLFVFNKDSKLQISADNPVYVQEADPNTGYKWLTKFDNPANGGNIVLTLVWNGHFTSSAQFDGSWGLAAESWFELGIAGIDDQYHDKYGRRSIDEITNMPNGIGAYGVAFIVDPTGGGKGQMPNDWTWLNATKTSYALPISSLSDGSSIVIWLQCFDFAGATETVKLNVNVDRSPPEVKEATFSANGIDESTSSLSINTSDKSSGIMQISFAIYDSMVKNLIYSGNVSPKKRQPPPQKRKKRLVQPCTVNDTTCYCIPSGDCYDYIQIVEIDNCWLDRLAGHTFELRFTVANGANLTSAEQTVALGELSLSCRRNVPVAGIVIGCILGVLLLVALVIIIVLVIRVYVCKKPAPRRLRELGKTVRGKFSAPTLDENIVYSGPDDYAPNNINKQKFGQNPSKAKQSKGSDEQDYVYNDLESNLKSENGKVISNRNLDHGDIISEGRFAIIRKGRLTQGGENIQVATKGLKCGFIDADVKLMEEKVATLSRLPRNANVVECLGRLDNDQGSGPVMVLEYCDMTLKDWLSGITKVNSDVLEEMLNFTSNIACGVKFLHENKVNHRRLGARNVLLKRQSNGLVAKLIGFGPNREDRDGEHTSVPIKWFAPETLQTFRSGFPTYNTKTDAWSFGITVWEIFSKGEAPFPSVSSDKVKDLLTKEKRMVLTCPEDCSKEFFESVVMPCWSFKPKQRPEFSKICSKIETFRRGNDSPQGYYTMSEDSKPEDQYGQPALYIDAA